MKRQLGVAVAAIGLAAWAGAGSPQGPPPVAPNPGNPQAANSDNGLAVLSSEYIHNGYAVRGEAQTGIRSENVHLEMGK